MIINRVPLRDRARGQWRAILLKSGIDANCLTGKNSPCPMCGGRDRFKFFDSGNNGTWFCRQCSPQGGAGADLIMRFCGLDFLDAAKLIERHLAVTTYTKPIKPAPDPRPKLQTMWAASKPVTPGDVVDTYLRSRGVALEQYPPCLRTAPSLPYYGNDATSIFPAMLAAVTDATGKPVTIHRTYIARDGCGKARVEKPRKVVSKHAKGPHVRLTPIAPTMGIAEGIETAISAMKLFNVATWAALSAFGLETFEPPAGLQRLIVFADHDANGTGQKAAHMLAARLTGKIATEVRFPDRPGDDWNDVLRRR